jgi:serine/threonine-protein kinase
VPALGQLVGNYRLEGPIGRGGQGVVYRAVHVRLGTEHAIKLLSHTSGPLRERMLEEGRIQARLRHPNLVPVTDVVELDGELGLVAELVPGVPLDVWVAAEEPDLAARLAVFRQVCAGLGGAHAAGVVHRDLKPQNVLVEVRDGVTVARVTDFGVAKVIDAARGGRGATLPGLPVGTPGYMAPEQVRDAARVDARADVFALGCLLYELACDERPFRDDDLAAYMEALETGTYPSVASQCPLAPAGVTRAVDACLRPDPAARPATCAAVVALLDDIPEVPLRSPTRFAGLGDPPPLRAGAAETLVPEPALPPMRLRAWWLGALAFVGAIAWGIHPPADPPPADTPTGEAATAPAPLPGTALSAAGPAAGPAAASSVEVAPGGGAAAPAVPIVSSPAVADAAPDAAPAEATEPRPGDGGAPTPAGTSASISARSTAPAAVRPGRVAVSGDGAIAWLASGGERTPPDHVPPGHYEVWARFADGEPVHAGDVSVHAGETVRLRCNQPILQCRPEEAR